MSIVEQLVDEVVEKVMEEESIMKLIENVEMEQKTLERIMYLMRIKLLDKRISDGIKRISDVIKCDMKPTMINDLRIGEEYIVSYGSGPIYLAIVKNIEEDEIITMEYLDSKILRDNFKWYRYHGGDSKYRLDYTMAHGCYYHVKKNEK